jgi:hypothetical protein
MYIKYVITNTGFSFFDIYGNRIVPTKTADFAKGQGGYLNLQTENTTHFNNISSDDWIANLFITKTLNHLIYVTVQNCSLHCITGRRCVSGWIA